MATYYFQEARPGRGGYFELVDIPSVFAENPEPIIEQFHRVIGKEEPYFGWLSAGSRSERVVQRVRASSCVVPAKCLKALRTVRSQLDRSPKRFPGFAWVALEQSTGSPKSRSSSLNVRIDGQPCVITAGWDSPMILPGSTPNKPKKVPIDSKITCTSPNGVPYVVVFLHRTLAEEFDACLGEATRLLDVADRNGSLVYISEVA